MMLMATLCCQKLMGLFNCHLPSSKKRNKIKIKNTQNRISIIIKKNSNTLSYFDELN